MLELVHRKAAFAGGLAQTVDRLIAVGVGCSQVSVPCHLLIRLARGGTVRGGPRPPRSSSLLPI